jgi:hypothetical protein
LAANVGSAKGVVGVTAAVLTEEWLDTQTQHNNKNSKIEIAIKSLFSIVSFSFSDDERTLVTLQIGFELRLAWGGKAKTAVSGASENATGCQVQQRDHQPVREAVASDGHITSGLSRYCSGKLLMKFI